MPREDFAAIPVADDKGYGHRLGSAAGRLGDREVENRVAAVEDVVTRGAGERKGEGDAMRPRATFLRRLAFAHLAEDDVAREKTCAAFLQVDAFVAVAGPSLSAHEGENEVPVGGADDFPLPKRFFHWLGLAPRLVAAPAAWLDGELPLGRALAVRHEQRAGARWLFAAATHLYACHDAVHPLGDDNIALPALLLQANGADAYDSPAIIAANPRNAVVAALD